MLRLVSEVSVLEDTLMRVILIGLTKEYPFSTADALELADQLVKRAASLNAPGRALTEMCDFYKPLFDKNVYFAAAFCHACCPVLNQIHRKSISQLIYNVDLFSITVTLFSIIR